MSKKTTTAPILLTESNLFPDNGGHQNKIIVKRLYGFDKKRTKLRLLYKLDNTGVTIQAELFTENGWVIIATKEDIGIHFPGQGIDLPYENESIEKFFSKDRENYIDDVEDSLSEMLDYCELLLNL